jgi:hypothetical protein
MRWQTALAVAGLAAGLVLPAAAERVRITVQSVPPPPPEFATPQLAAPEVSPAPELAPLADRPAVELAILLDTSSSMSGLIDQARRQLWTIVNQFASAEKDGQPPRLRVALFEYGNTKLPASEGYLRQVVPLTDDLDQLSAALFALTTTGGDEYCGQVIDEAVTRLDWCSRPGGYKAIFIAGNEPFSQGPVDYRQACRRAIERGIVVNTIHCGDARAGVAGHWQHGAQLAEGEPFNIDMDRVITNIPTPHDTIIIELNAKLNNTYLWFGREAQSLRENQAVQDRNAADLAPAAAVARTRTKTTSNYLNVGRDLVDTLAAEPDALVKLEPDQLPEPMRAMTPEQREAHVRAMAAERELIQQQIAEQVALRDAFVAEVRTQQAEAGGDATLGDAMGRAVRQQLTDAGFSLK